MREGLEIKCFGRVHFFSEAQQMESRVWADFVLDTYDKNIVICKCIYFQESTMTFVHDNENEHDLHNTM